MVQSQPLFNYRERLAKYAAGDKYVRGGAAIHFDYAESCYKRWPTPTCIISDGPYGIDGFPGDMRTADSLAEWYEPHIRAWRDHSTLETTLWFWNTEVGWATVHPVLEANGWHVLGC